jgi:lysophospholipase L1-like esterase
MKRFKTLLSVRVVVIILVLAMSAACSLITKPWIRSATMNDVVNIGDSIFALSGKIQEYLTSYTGKSFRNYSFSGAYLSGTSIITSNSVVVQYGIAKSDNSNIKTIIMDGGGNEILIPANAFDPYNCKKDWWESGLSSSCKSLIDDAYVDAVDLMNQMGRDGVKNIIWQGYYHVKNGLFASTSLNPAVDYGNTRLAQAVANATAVNNYRVFINPVSVMTNSDIIIDGVHPSDSGSRKLANLIWPKLQPLL